MRRSLWTTSMLTVAVAACFLCGDAARAKKPDNPGGGNDGGGQNGGGVIYFGFDGQLYTINADGSDTTVVAGYLGGVGYGTDPSHQLHGGKRWFLSYTGQGVVAASDAGDDVSLFQDPHYDIGLMRWQIGDAGISWIGRERDHTGAVVEGGLYTTPVTFYDDGNISPGDTELLMSLPLVSDSSGTLWPDVSYYDWSPDGAQFVSSSFSHDELRVGSIDTGEFEVLYSDSGRTVSDPRWSPAGDAIMFNHFTGWNEVDSINPDGSDYTKLAGSSPTSSRSVGVWSPTGSHLILKHFDRGLEDSYLLRANSNGGQRKRLTGKDVGDFLGPQVYGWREVPVAASKGFASVPEPSTATIVVIGLSTLLGSSRRRAASNCWEPQ